MASALAWWGTIQQLILKQPFGSRPAPDAVMLLVGVVFGIGFPLFFLSLRMITEVRNEGIWVRFVPLQRGFRKWACGDIIAQPHTQQRKIREKEPNAKTLWLDSLRIAFSVARMAFLLRKNGLRSLQPARTNAGQTSFESIHFIIFRSSRPTASSRLSWSF